MNIEPDSGIGKIKFGMIKGEVETLLGQPDEISNPGGQDLIHNEKWIYSSLGLELSFDPDMDFRFDGCYITSKTACLDEVSIVGLSEKELVLKFPRLMLNGDSGKFKEYIHRDNEMYIDLVDDIVKAVNISPNIRNFSYEYSSKSYKRMMASKRLRKKAIRKGECIFSKKLVKVWGQVDESNLLDLEKDFEWFLTERLELDVFPESMWCDGTKIHSIIFSSDKSLTISGTADILSSNDDDFYQICIVDGFIVLNNNRTELKQYRLSLKYDDKVFIAKKGASKNACNKKVQATRYTRRLT